MARYLIFGAGAVGTLLGGLLAGAGQPVTFVGRKWNADGIRNNGIRISGVWGDLAIGSKPAYETVSDIPNNERSFDFVIITVKTFDTEHAIDQCVPILSDNTIVISCQNGYGNCQIIASRIGWKRTLGMRIITGVEIPEPGTVNVTVHADAVRFGHYLHEIPIETIETIAQPMKDARIPVEATDKLEQYVWAKILYNAALNPLGALLGVMYGDLANNAETRSIMDSIIDEAFAVTTAHGIEQFWDSANAYRKAFYEQMIPPTATHFPSMLRDLERGRRTEIGALNGAVTKLGREKNIPTPVNDTIVSLMNFREKKKNCNISAIYEEI